MVTLPTPTAEMRPAETVATVGSDVVHVAAVVTSCAPPPETIADATSCNVVPATISNGLGCAVTIWSRSIEEGGAPGDEPTAVPVRATDALSPDSELTVSHADRLPGVLGRNCTLIMHVAPAGSVGAQFVDIGKSAVSVLARPMVSPVVVDSVTVDV